MRRVWTVIVLAFAAAPVLYGLVLLLITGAAHHASTIPPMTFPLTTLRWVLYILGAASLGGGLFLFTRVLELPNLDPAGFQQRTIISLALIEAAAVLGFVLAFLSRSVMDYVPSGVASWGAILLWVIPRGTAYWNRIEGRG